MMLGAVLPEMRHQAEALAADLADLVRLRKEIADERDRLARDLLVLADERQRMSPADRRAAEEAGRDREGARRRAPARRRAGAPGRHLKDLIGKLEQGSTAPRAPRARPRAPGDDNKARTSRPDLAALKDPGRLAPAVAFAVRQGNAAAAGQRRENHGNSALRTASAAPKRAFPSPPGRAARSRLRVMAGWFMPDPSAITANS